MNPVRAGLATRRIRASRPPAFSSISRHSAAVRWSFHNKAGRMTRPSVSRKTEPCIWPLRPSPATSSGRNRPDPRTCCTVSTVATHQSSGSCSDQPGRGWSQGYSAVAEARIVPRSSMASVLVPEVPMSIPSVMLTA